MAYNVSYSWNSQKREQRKTNDNFQPSMCFYPRKFKNSYNQVGLRTKK